MRQTAFTQKEANRLIDDPAELDEWHALQAQLRFLEQKKEACLRVKELESGVQRTLAILTSRYYHNFTLDECADRLGLTRERIRQIEAMGMRVIRQRVGARGGLNQIIDLLAELDQTRSMSRMDMVA